MKPAACCRETRKQTEWWCYAAIESSQMCHSRVARKRKTIATATNRVRPDPSKTGFCPEFHDIRSAPKVTKTYTVARQKLLLLMNMRVSGGGVF